MLSIVIPTRNRGDVLPKTLAALRKLSARDIEILIVDNASEDASFDVLSEGAKADDRIRVLRNPQNLGIFRSLFRGLVSASHDWLLLLSDEDAVTDAYLDDLRSVRRAHPSVKAALVPQGDYTALPMPRAPVIVAAGRPAAYAAFWVGGYIGGIAFDRRRVDLSAMPLDRSLFVQRWLVCTLALRNDVCLLPYEGRLLSEVNRSERTEFLRRSGDWAIGEWMDHVDLVFNGPGAVSEFLPAARGECFNAARLKVFQMFTLYLQRAMQAGEECASTLIKSVLSDPRFAGDLTFWESLFNDLLGMPAPQRDPLLTMFQRARTGS